MTTAQPQPEERRKLSLDFDEPAPLSEREAITLKVEEISEKTGFTARVRPQPERIAESSPKLAAERKPAATAVPKSAAALQPLPEMPARRKRGKTGRTYPFNTKLRKETYDQICAQADAATAREGRVVSLAEIVERAMNVLVRQGQELD